MLDAIEPLLFNRGDQLPVANNCSRRIAVVSVESEDIHGQNLIPAIKVSFTIGSNKEIAISAINADADLRAVSLVFRKTRIGSLLRAQLCRPKPFF